jgi:hypothetical protein
MTMRRIGTELMTALLVVIFLAGNVLPVFAENTAKSGAKTYSDVETFSDIVTYSDVETFSDIVTYSDVETFSDIVTYSDFVTYVESYVYTDFYEYVDDVQVKILKPADYSAASVLLENGRSLDIGKVAENMVSGAGDIVMVALTTAAIPIPGVNVISASVLTIIVASASVITAAIAGTMAYLKSGGDINKTIENTSEGFMWAAMAVSMAIGAGELLAGAKLAIRTAKTGAAKVLNFSEAIKTSAKAAVNAGDKANDVKKVTSVAKVANKADDVADAAKLANKADDVVDTAKAVDRADDVADAAKAAGKIDNLAAVKTVDDAVDEVTAARKAMSPASAAKQIEEAAAASKAAIKDLMEKIKKGELPVNIYIARYGNQTEPRLPDSINGKPIFYIEFDVFSSPVNAPKGRRFMGFDNHIHRRQPNTQRILVGSDGKVYYSPNHYGDEVIPDLKHLWFQIMDLGPNIKIFFNWALERTELIYKLNKGLNNTLQNLPWVMEKML